MLTTFVVHVDDRPGVLNRVASLFRRRVFNIESLTVGHSDKPGVSRMTIVVDTDELGGRRIEAHLYKLVNVLKVENITVVPSVFRDLALIKVSATSESRPLRSITGTSLRSRMRRSVSQPDRSGITMSRITIPRMPWASASGG